MLALQGNTAPYLLYAVVRIAGIARKGGDGANTGDAGNAGDSNAGNSNAGDSNQITGLFGKLQFHEPQEWALVRHLLGFDAVIAEVEEELLPNRLCSYLFELSQVFNRFYDQVPVLKAPPEARNSRLALCRLTADTLKLGLGLLGIPTLERM
jgi:arginyl-tRNA synthetase